MILDLRIFLTIVLSFFIIQSKAELNIKYREINLVNDSCKIKTRCFTKKFTPKIKKLYSDKYYFWVQNDQLYITQGNFSGQILDGNYEQYYKSGQLMAKGNLTKGLKTGKWQFWKQNGQLTSEVYYKDGQVNGLVVEYDSIGEICHTIHYKKNIPNGVEQIVFHKKVILKNKYKNGKLISSASFQTNSKKKKTIGKTKTKKTKNIEKKANINKPKNFWGRLFRKNKDL